MKNMFSKKGFTLIEILIVVAIIGILASVVVVGLGPAQRKGRDSRRLSDLRQVQTALELYYGKNGAYPNASIGDWAAFSAVLTGAGIGTSQIPNDPAKGKNYVYLTDANGTTYVLGAELEEPTPTIMTSSYKGSTLDNGTPLPTGASCGSASFYCLTL